jgi:hypothetical protein
MEATSPRPTALSVIGWGSIVVGILMFFSGGMAALSSSMIPSGPARSSPSPPGGMDFVFRNFLYFGLGQMGLSVVIVMAGKALLRFRRWGSIVIQAFAGLLLAYATVFTIYFAVDMQRSFSDAAKSPPTAFLAMMSVMLLFNLLFWATPTVLTIYHLRKLDAQRMLR